MVQLRLALRLLVGCLSWTRADTHIYTANQDGSIQHLQLADDRKTLEVVGDSVDTWSAIPSWLSYDIEGQKLWCLANSSGVQPSVVGLLTVGNEGSLRQSNAWNVSGRPTHSKFYAGGDAIVIAHSDHTNPATGDVTAFNVSSDRSQLTEGQTFHFGVDTSTLDPETIMTHASGVEMDPTKRFIVVTDRDADRLHVLRIDPEKHRLWAGPTFTMPAGTGPRRALFWPLGEDKESELYVLGQHSNSITRYAVEYGDDGNFMTLMYRGNYPTANGDMAWTAGTQSSEMMRPPTGNFIVVSQLGDKSAKNSDAVSDSLSTLEVQEDGSLRVIQIAAAGGLNPRHFRFNGAGNEILVGTDSNVVVLSRDVENGKIGQVVVSYAVAAAINAVAWNA